MNILTFGHAYLDREWNYSHVRSPFTRVYFVLGGEGILHYNGKDVKLLPGNVYVVPSELEIDMRCYSVLEKFFFHINLSRHNTQDLLSHHNECIELKNRKPDIEKVLQYWQSNSAESAIAVKALLYRTILDAVKQENVSFPKAENYSMQTGRALDFIENNLNASLTVETIANNIFVSASSLQKIFRKEVGVPIGRYINDLLMLKAERMLHLKDYSIKEISAQLGFCDQFYFSRCFLKCYGATPTEYRKNIKI
jgi:AraC-like DNA-binding protein